MVDAVGSSTKKIYEGKEYDFVFDVDIQDGVPALKLPYNAAGIYTSYVDNPFLAAQQFIERNELPQDYLDQIANFVITNSKGVTIGAETSALQDPFTGT